MKSSGGHLEIGVPLDNFRAQQRLETWDDPVLLYATNFIIGLRKNSKSHLILFFVCLYKDAKQCYDITDCTIFPTAYLANMGVYAFYFRSNNPK